MKRLIVATALTFLVMPSFAEVAAPDPIQQAVSQELMDSITRSIQWRAEAIKAQAEVAALKLELEKLKPATATITPK